MREKARVTILYKAAQVASCIQYSESCTKNKSVNDCESDRPVDIASNWAT